MRVVVSLIDLHYTQSGIKVLKWAGTRRYGVPADAISVPADSASSVVPPDPSVHLYHCT